MNNEFKLIKIFTDFIYPNESELSQLEDKVQKYLEKLIEMDIKYTIDIRQSYVDYTNTSAELTIIVKIDPYDANADVPILDKILDKLAHLNRNKNNFCS